MRPISYLYLTALPSVSGALLRVPYPWFYLRWSSLNFIFQYSDYSAVNRFAIAGIPPRHIAHSSSSRSMWQTASSFRNKQNGARWMKVVVCMGVSIIWLLLCVVSPSFSRYLGRQCHGWPSGRCRLGMGAVPSCCGAICYLSKASIEQLQVLICGL